MEHIAIDFRAGKENSYKNFIHFKGNNVICSEQNIAICVGNNQTLEIYGEEDSTLKAISGVNMPVIGSGKYSSGAGNIIFSNKGSIMLEVGKSNNAETSMPWIGRNGSYALGFCNEDKTKSSSIKILDHIKLKAIGEDGENIKSISSENTTGNGGAAIYLNDNDYLIKSSDANMCLIGGNGGRCIGEYSSGKCGDGGPAIKINGGIISIFAPASLKGGNGGSIEKDSLCILAPGGNGGDGILVLGNEYSDDLKLLLTIGDDVEITAGNGGNSGYCMNDKGISGVNGGNGGNLINGGETSIELQLGNIKGIVGCGGIGGCNEPPCKDGENGKDIIGEKIIIKEALEEINDEEKREDNVLEEDILEEINNEENTKENILEEVYNDVVKEDEKEEIYEILTDDILSNKEEETGLEVYKKEKKPNFIIRFFRWLFGRS